MKVFVPGKLVVTGAYAVLHGSPAVVIAVSRGLTATRRDADTNDIDASAMFIEDKKLGLGVSAASDVANVAVWAAAAGDNLESTETRAKMFADARALHAKRDGGGSGIDVAASVHGGTLVYALRAEVPSMRAVSLPAGVTISAFFSGESARTPDLRGMVDALRTNDERAFKSAMEPLARAAKASVTAIDTRDASAFIVACRDTGIALAALGDVANAPIVPQAFRELASIAAEDGAAFLPSGAGGGDSGIFVGTRAPSSRFLERVTSLRFIPLDVRIDARGVRLV